MTHNAYTPEEPIAAIATALVPAALGIVRTSGANAVALVSRVFSRPRALCEAEGNSLVYGWITDGDGTKIDEVMVAVYRAPKSFTGEEMAEIFCHGGTATVLGVYNLLLKNGFRAAQKGEYTFRAFINGKADLTKAEAVREIIDARTDQSRAHALGRLEGALYGEIESIKQDAVHAMAALEVEIEYPEDEENIAESFDPAPIVAVKERLMRLSRSWAAEKLYQDGAQVVLCGKTNAGKSSLFNILLKEERAIVSDIRGTTRDWLESWAQFDGVPVRLYDTAGLRETEDIIEQKGVERTKDLINKADVILYVADGTIPLDEEDRAFLESFGAKSEEGGDEGNEHAKCNGRTEGNERGCTENGKCIEAPAPSTHNDSPSLVLVLNKADCAGEDAFLRTKDAWHAVPCVHVSAKNGYGITELTAEVTKLLKKAHSSEEKAPSLGSARQKDAVEDALSSINHALSALGEGFTVDAVVQDLEDAIASLGEVTGEVTSDDILETVFSSFCVGK